MPPKRARAAAAASAEPSLILCYGDSNTYGQSDVCADRLPYVDRWTTVLQSELGSSFLVVPEGLNGRTTVHDDPCENAAFSGLGGSGMNGRRYLLPCLYSHRPIAAVVLALGCNDLKKRHNLDAGDVAAGVENLVADITNSTAGPDGKAPAIVIMSPPALVETPQAKSWGFQFAAAKSLPTIAELARVAKDAGVPCVNVSHIHAVGADGIHIPAEAAAPVGKEVASAVLRALA